MEYCKTTKSGTREINEDYCGASLFYNTTCVAVADGLGGHGGGDVASKCAVNAVCELFEKTGYTDTFFDDAFMSVQAAILREQEAANKLSQMKTTLVILVQSGNVFRWAHIGDSRLYYFKNGKLKTRTLDHSVPQMLVMSGEIKEKDIRHHPDRNRLMRVLGVKGETPRFEVGTPIKRRGTQAFLLCTDGYWELIDESEMERTLKQSNSPEEWIAAMTRIVEKNGQGSEMDNYTAIAVFEKTKGFFGR